MLDKRPQPYTKYPISEGVIGIGEMSQVRGTSELYFPFLFSKISCEIKKFNFIFENMRESKIEIEFKLTGNENYLKDLYHDEKWKIMGTENFLKSFDGEKPKHPLPIFALMLNKTMHTTSAELKIDGKDDIIIFDQSVDVIMLPSSYPPVVNLEEDSEDYIFYEKKVTAFYGDLYLNKTYKLTIYSYSGNPEFAPLFPYGKVNYDNINYQSNSLVDININFQIVTPEKSKKLPIHIQEKFNRYFEKSPRMPKMSPAFKNRGDYSTFLPDGTYGLPNLLEKNKENFNKLQEISLSNEDISGKEFIDYGTFRFIFRLLMKGSDELEIIVKTTNSPIPIRIYEQIQKLPEYKDILVDYEIINLGKKKRRLKVITKIIDFTEDAKKTYFLHGIGNKNNNKLVIKFNQVPRLKRGILETIVQPEKAVLSCIVYDEDLKETLFEENYNIEILPHDQILWYIGSTSGSVSHNIAPLVISWISPTDKDGLLDSVRAGALKYHSDRSFSINNESTLDEVDEVVGSIYKYLNDDIGINYVNQPFTSNNPIHTQRILTPGNVLKNKVGNCIDLTITIASILEGLGLSSLIFLTPGHAFIGWGNKRKTDEMLFLETTFLGQKSYGDAKKYAKYNFKQEFLYIGSSDPMPNSLMLQGKGCQIIDLSEERAKGIYAINN